MGMNKPDIHNSLELRRTSGIFDHFNSYTDTQLWTAGGSGGTVANSDGDGGILTLTTGAAQDQDAIVRTTRKLYTFVSGKPMLFQIGLSYTEANTNQAGIFVGFASSFTDILTDTTYALPASISACGIFKKPGDILWSAFTSVGTTQYTTQSKTSCIQAGLPQELVIQVMLAGSNLEATFWAGGFGATASGRVPMLPNVTTMAAMQPIKHVIAYSGAVAMYAGASVKAGSSSSEVVSVDYLGTEFLSMP